MKIIPAISPETVLRQFADPDDQDGDGISGRMARAGNGIGRFGWKAKFPRLDDAVAAALVNELGLTTALFPKDTYDDRDVRQVEVDGANLQALVEFVRSLQPLPSESIEPQTRNQAEGLSHTVGCDGCHRPTLQVAALPNGGPPVIRPYTDLLLHDMGPALGDGLAEGSAGPQEFRTPPLWGISRTGPPYLHDGRAATIQDAIAAHGGEGQRSADSYTRLTAVQRKALLDFIASR